MRHNIETSESVKTLKLLIVVAIGIAVFTWWSVAHALEVSPNTFVFDTDPKEFSVTFTDCTGSNRVLEFYNGVFSDTLGMGCDTGGYNGALYTGDITSVSGDLPQTVVLVEVNDGGVACEVPLSLEDCRLDPSYVGETTLVFSVPESGCGVTGLFSTTDAVCVVQDVAGKGGIAILSVLGITTTATAGFWVLRWGLTAVAGALG